MKIPVLVFCLLICSTALISAQTAAEMDILLETNETSMVLAARFVLGALGMIPAGLSGGAAEREAYAMALERGWIKGEANSAITLKELSFLVMNACGISGGVVYSIVPSPRYAYRELKYRKIIQGRTDPSMKVPGLRLLQIIDRALVYSGESEKIDSELALPGAEFRGMAR